MDIKSGSSYPSSALSNFAPHRFIFDGVECASMEGLLQSFKFQSVSEQHEVCVLAGKEAKNRGTEQNDRWQASQTLWWNGKAYVRNSKRYQRLLDRAYDALEQNSDFCVALLATGLEPLEHSIGSTDPCVTVLTETEFISRLLVIRQKLQVRLVM